LTKLFFSIWKNCIWNFNL